ncbi:hypothetical protein GCM10009647_004090 [Streptomyces sanglieri]
MECEQSVERPDQIASLGHQLADSRDGRAIRGVLAVALAGLSKEHGAGAASRWTPCARRQGAPHRFPDHLVARRTALGAYGPDLPDTARRCPIAGRHSKAPVPQ